MTIWPQFLHFRFRPYFIRLYLCELPTANKLCSCVGTSTCGTSRGWPARTCRWVTAGGRWWTRPLRSPVRVRIAAAPRPSPPSATDKSTWNSTHRSSLPRWSLCLVLPSFADLTIHFEHCIQFYLWVKTSTELVSLCLRWTVIGSTGRRNPMEVSVRSAWRRTPSASASVPKLWDQRSA